MRTSDADLALQWLAEAGITPVGPGRWLDSKSSGVTEMSNDDVAFACAYPMVFDDESGPVRRVRTALGLLDLTGEFEVLTHLNAYVVDHADPAVIDTFWAGCRARMEVADPIENLRLSLRTYWFVGGTSKAAFAAMIGDDVRRLAAEDRLPRLAHGPLHRRARHVLEDSGTVCWADKHDIFRAAATVGELHPAVFHGLLAGYHAVYGDLQPAETLTLLEHLRLPTDAEGLAQLRAVLRKGAKSHYDDPSLWNAQ
ncbi:hypothetical protein ACQEVC_36670 [Plantactinospora sp. CA-294935]|uniref:hypothetical protein n=1 Tax=Plantactinospora sp. CA-294935 TaxID=3240012 RepID=UPI003D8FA267